MAEPTTIPRTKPGKTKPGKISPIKKPENDPWKVPSPKTNPRPKAFLN